MTPLLATRCSPTGRLRREPTGTSDLVNLGTTDIFETDKFHLILLSVPGVRDEDISIDVRGDTLVVTGERRSVFEKDAGVNYLMRESSYGRFTRRFRLPVDADTSKLPPTTQRACSPSHCPRRLPE